MDRSKKLALRRETLTRLGTAELDGIVGATHIPTDCGCITHNYSCDACPIPSLPINTCNCPTGPIRCLPIQTA